jgi:hypothetical protein
MSKLLQSGHSAPVAEWQAELDAWQAKSQKVADTLAAKEEEAANPARDPWFGEQMKPEIEALKTEKTRTERIVAMLKEKLSEAQAARPAALKELTAAYKERDALAAEIVKRYPELVAELADLMNRAAANEYRLMKVAVAGEGEIDSTSPWDKARGIEHRPLVIKGPKKAAPAVILHALSEERLWPKGEVALSKAELPAICTVTNKGDKPAIGYHSSGRPWVIEPGHSLTTTQAASLTNIMSTPSVEVTIR